MAALELLLDYNLRLSNDELVLILRALGGRMNDAERDEARELEVRIQTVRSRIVKTRLSQNEVLIANLSAAGGK